MANPEHLEILKQAVKVWNVGENIIVSWKDCHWPERLREQIMEYNILDFSDWKNEDTFRHMFGRLIDGLDLFYK